jgi:sugar/nucleoside kinase (ribokinase family)
MKQACEVLVVGRSCIDHIAVVETFPRENTKAAITHRLVEGGGQGGTAAACIARLGGRVCYVGRLGDDGPGRICLQRLAAFGVDTRRVQILPGGRTPEAFIFVTAATGDRTIFYEPNRLPRLEARDLPDGLFSRAPVLLLDPETTYLSDLLPEKGRLQVVYDAERWRDGMATMLQRADYFIPSRDFLDDERAGCGGGRLADRLDALQMRIEGQLVVTDGCRGAYYFHRGRLMQVPAPAVAVRDTIGAGDNFHASFALALSRGADLPEAVQLAVAVASLSCRAYGGREGLPSMAQARTLAATLIPRPYSPDDPPHTP